MSNTVVQYVLLRSDLLKDLGWSIGSLVAQACHASTAVLHLYKDDETTAQYLSDLDNMHKVVLEVPNEESLRKAAEKLKENSIDHKLWIEQPENIPTCLALKPYPKDHVKKYVGKFKLYKATLDRKETSFDYVDADSIIDYPSEWFLKHPNQKPPVIIPATTLTPEEIYKAARGGIRVAELSLATAKLVLYTYTLTTTDILEEDWKSFGLTIGHREEEINPWDLVDVKVGPYHQSPEQIAVTAPRDQLSTGIDHSSWTPKSLALYILCVYRMLKVTNPEYEKQLEGKMNNQLASEGGKGMTVHGVKNVYMSWLSDRNFLKMVAAIDMFFYRFNTHESAILSLGSLGSRFRDCAGLMSFGYAINMLNIEPGDLMDWIWIKPMGEEMLHLTNPGQETGDKYSYFPYQADFHLISKSAYSSITNPYLFHWIHIIGSLIGHRRSINARFNFEGSFADISLNAVVLTWAYVRGGDLVPQYSRTGEDIGRDIEALEKSIEEEGAVLDLTPEDRAWLDTTGKNPETWYALLKSGGFQLPPVVKRVMSRQAKKIREVRESTVGEYVKDHLIY